jgi:methionine-rich copper-binding protein CopC
MKKLSALLLVGLVSTASAYTGGTKFIKATPADGSVNGAPPTAIILEFSKPVQVHDADLKKDADKPKRLNSLPYNKATTITIPVPSLTAGHYVLEWSVFTMESAVLRGRLGFTVSAAPAADAASPR